jgi:methionyl-tRNA synthetase
MRYLVTATPPTPNGALHLGHLSGPYLAGDILTRHLRRTGADVVHLTGIDDHQSYTALRATRDGTTPQHVADAFGDAIERGWAGAGIDYDLTVRPRVSPVHRDLVREVFLSLWRAGHIVARTTPLPYCVPCDGWAFEAYVVGTCPHCGADSCGNACEVCGEPNDCADLGAPRCNVCGTPCEPRECERLYLPLEPHRDLLTRLHGQVGMNGHLDALARRMLRALPEIAVSHPADWGIEVPVDGFTDQRIYVWFEMAAGYLAAARQWAANGPDRADAWATDRTIVQCFGYDNGYFHLLLFPAIMAAYAPDTALPSAFISNEFYRLDGQKFSTSRRHAIWLLDALDEHPADHLRLYLSMTRPVADQASFTRAGFEAAIHGDLLPRWSAWLAALARRASRVPATGADPWEPDHPLTRRLPGLVSLVDDALGVAGFSPRLAVAATDLIAREAAEWGGDTDHLYGVPGAGDAYARAVAAELDAAATFAACLVPVAPAMARQLWLGLGLPGTVEDLPWSQVRAGLRLDSKIENLVAACPLFHPPAHRPVATPTAGA